MKRVSFILVSLVLVIASVIVFAVPAAATSTAPTVVLPTHFSHDLVPAINDSYYLNLDVGDSVYWERYLSGEVRFTHTGAVWNDESSQERLLDNIYYKIFPYGQDVFVNFSGTQVFDYLSFSIIFDADFVAAATQSFNIRLTASFDIYDPDTGEITSTPEYGGDVVSYTPGVSSYTLKSTESPSVGGGDPVPLRISYYVRFSGLTDQSITDQVKFNLSVSSTTSVLVPSHYKDFVQDSDFSSSLDQMIGEQEQTNENLDQIINGDVEPQPPAGSSDIQDAVGAEDELLQDMMSDYENNKQHLTTGDTSLRSFYPSLQVIVRLLNLFLAIDFFKHLSYISLSLGVLVVLLNVGSAIIDRSDRSARYAASDSRRGRKGRH